MGSNDRIGLSIVTPFLRASIGRNDISRVQHKITFSCYHGVDLVNKVNLMGTRKRKMGGTALGRQKAKTHLYVI